MEELVIGVKKADLDELKELKVKLPVRLLVHLHYVRLTESRAISEVVNQALTEYFGGVAALRNAKAAAAGEPLERSARPTVLGAAILVAPSSPEPFSPDQS